MNQEKFPATSNPASSSNSTSRRVFLKQSGFAVGAMAMPWTLAYGMQSISSAVPGLALPICSAVVSLHMDQPYVDLSGAAFSYQACGVTAAAQPLMALSETEWRMRYPYL